MSDGGTRWPGIILAAGQSRRFGDKDKLRHSWRGKAVLRHAVDNALAAGLQPLFVITRPNQTLPALPADIRQVLCPDAEHGMGRGLRAGLAAIPDDAPGCAILLGDMPDIKTDTIRAMATETNADSAIRPSFDGKPGHPVFIPKALFDKAALLQGEEGLKAVLGDAITVLPLDDPGVIWDIDSPNDLKP